MLVVPLPLIQVLHMKNDSSDTSVSTCWAHPQDQLVLPVDSVGRRNEDRAVFWDWLNDPDILRMSTALQALQ